MRSPRCWSALLLALLPATAGVAQAPSSAAWTLPSGEYTIFGHTIYRSNSILIPRVVYDTARRLDSARVVDSVRPAVRTMAGLAAGFSAWPADLYCAGPTSAVLQSLEPRRLLARVQLAARCGVRLVIVPPRRLLTTNGQPVGVFSPDSARRLMDRYAAVLPPDTLRKYHATILGLNLADDYGCARCWGGTPITQVQIAQWAAEARSRLPGVPLGVRVTPDWVAEHPPLAPLLDYTWAQYHARKGEAQAYFDRAAKGAAALGLRVVMGLNAEDCYGVGTEPCSAADLVRYGTIAVSHPESCAFISWRYAAETWQRTEMREAWAGLWEVARHRSAQECRRM